MTSMSIKPAVKSKAHTVAKTKPSQPRSWRNRPPLDIAMLKNLWRDGVPVKEIAKKLDCSPSSVYSQARKHALGYNNRDNLQIMASTVKKLTSLPSWRVRAIALKSRGWAPGAIAKHLGVGIAEVNVFLKHGSL